jgi:hypothetical protein
MALSDDCAYAFLMAKGSGRLVKIKTQQRRTGATFEILPEVNLDALNIAKHSLI